MKTLMCLQINKLHDFVSLLIGVGWSAFVILYSHRNGESNGSDLKNQSEPRLDLSSTFIYIANPVHRFRAIIPSSLNFPAHVLKNKVSV